MFALTADGARVLEYWHNRVWASSPDEAAMKARDKVMEKFGREVKYLKLKEVDLDGWYEFYCILS
mgnify:CR=1 FL=1